MQKTKLKKQNGLRNFFIRLAAFITIYTLVSIFHLDILHGIYGIEIALSQPWLVFLVYPILIFFTVLRWDKLKKIPNYRNSILQTLGFGLIGLVLILTPTTHVIEYFGKGPAVSYYLPLFLGHAAVFFSIFNLKFKELFHDDLVVFGLVLLSYLAISVLIDNYWQFFSSLIIKVLVILVPLMSPDAIINADTFFVNVEGFSVIVGPPCAGIYSMVTFALLFGMSLFFLGKSKKIKKMKAFIAFLLGIFAVFIFNIIRVIIILAVGAFYSQDLAINLFHEYLSSIFLLAIFTAYLYFVIPRVSGIKVKEINK
jgi:hypothetical protein